MDDVEITDVDDENTPYQVHRGPLKNQDLSSVSLTVGELLSQYGWHLLVVSVLVYLLIQHLMKRFRQREQHAEPQTHQDVASVVRNQEAMEAARRRMQEELDAKAAAFREKQKQTSEEAGPSTTVLKPKTDKKPLRGSDYNPLTGEGGGSCSYRPGRRGPSSGG
ncbi:selenoprotein S isoform X2 [Cheilinus undulatus]|uniref:selenoprotein S isoform X2 n=1 Tax=Cheilinus undulatus TaxID=241271 RepID=UPI001BD6D5AE|nr:selenoprotein S isoform X2 [Cheilinus undulatus]